MCGIVGVASMNAVPAREILLRMRDAVHHRGPDDSGVWWSADGRVGLAHRRLAIIDLSPTGRQPMISHDGDICLVLNGEIYNYTDLRKELEKTGHRFKGESDTEVLLAAYAVSGIDIVSKLNGMFAFAVYDRRIGKLFVARDRAGEKPLFYRHDANSFSFASELKSLLVDPSFPREIDPEALEFYLAYGYVTGSRCILRGFRKLLPGHFLEYDLPSGKLCERRYWDLPTPLRGAPSDPEELLDEMGGLLRDAVRRQLVADVPVGILLSGGIDSGLVTAMAAMVSSKPVRTFTVGLPGHAAFDERSKARAIASHFGTRHEELIAAPACSDMLPLLARQFDEPIADSSMLPTYLVSKLIRTHATVAIGGDGGDELFGGYPHYAWIMRQDTLRRVVPSALRSVVARGASAILPIGFRGRNYLIGASGALSRALSHVNVYFDAPARRRLLGRGFMATNGSAPESHKESLYDARLSPVQNATRIDFRTFMVDDILVKVDRASMLNSLEVRAPWLDYRLIEFAFGQVPDALRVGSGGLKILPKLLAKRLFPPDFDLEQKKGFSIPIDDWMRGDWNDLAKSVLESAPAGLFRQPEISRLVEMHMRGYKNGHRLFALVMFELWRREYEVQLPI